MTRSTWRVAAGLASALAVPAALRAADAPPKRPNVLVVVADDLACNELGCYGGRNAPTPYLDRLAADGMRFDLAFASTAMCVPFRASLYTGLYPVRHGTCRNHAATDAGTKSVVHHLGPLGYRVGLTGKSHVRPAPVYPFEKVSGFVPNCTAETAPYTLDGIRDFMTRDASSPFCLFVCSTHPHAPWTVGDASRFDPAALVLPPIWADTPEMRRAFAKYCAEIVELDRQVGDILKALDEAQLRDNTLVLFSGEQGPQFPGGKWTLFDHGLKSALIARWPGRVKAGAVSETLVQVEDILPTLVEAAGGAPPEGLDGRSFLRVLAGSATEHRDAVFGIHNNVPEGTPYPIRGIRTKTHKLLLNLLPDRAYFEKHVMQIDREDYWHSWVRAAKEDPQAARMVGRYVKRPAVELYDVRKDPWELENLADRPELAGVRRDLEARLRAWMEQQGDTGAALDVEEQPAAPKKPKAGKAAGKKPAGP